MRRVACSNQLFVEDAQQMQRGEQRRLRHLHVAHEEIGKQVARKRAPERVAVERRRQRAGRPRERAQIGDDLAHRVDRGNDVADIRLVAIEQRGQGAGGLFHRAHGAERIAHRGEVFARRRRQPPLPAHQGLEAFGRLQCLAQRIEHVEQRLAQAAEHSRIGHRGHSGSADATRRGCMGVEGCITGSRASPGRTDQREPAVPSSRPVPDRRSAAVA